MHKIAKVDYLFFTHTGVYLHLVNSRLLICLGGVYECLLCACVHAHLHTGLVS